LPQLARRHWHESSQAGQGGRWTPSPAGRGGVPRGREGFADAGRWSPAVSDAVVAAIRASDAVCAVELHQTWHGLDHGGATGLLVQTSIGTHGAGLLAALLPEKNRGQYTLMPMHEPRARIAYQQASELVDLAANSIRRAGQNPG
jgi:hypothetical protein